MPTPRALEALPQIRERLRQRYPDARYELNWSVPHELLVATILAAQSTDVKVNQVTAALFRRYPSPSAFAEAELSELEEAVRPTGFHRNKARAIQGACRVLVERFGGEVPRTVEALTTLPGVARKTANVVLNTAFDIPSGIIVDTHVARVARRMGLTAQEKPEQIEAELMRLIPREEWTFWGPAVVLHGRYTCTAVKPDCDGCGFNDLCERVGVG
jgi:endonuclease III